MLKMPLIINGTDFTELTERLGYTVSYEDRTAGKMTMLNGDEYIDLIARKPILTWSLDSLNTSDLAALHEAINAATYVSVTYYDTATDSVQTALFHGTISAQSVGVIRSSGSYRWRSSVLTMRAR